MLDNKAELREFKQKLTDYGVSISALSCHGNSLHPNANIAKANQEVNRRTILLAEKLEVPVVIDFSGCPGDSDSAKYPTGSPAPGRPSSSICLNGSGIRRSPRSGPNARSSPPITA